MSLTVHIPAYLRKPELLPALTLVFKTIRVGFPTARVKVYPGGPAYFACAYDVVNRLARETDCEVLTNHSTFNSTQAQFIRHVIENNDGINVLCDTDMVFWESVEGWDMGGTMLMGRKVPQFECPYAQAFTLSRLHTSLLWINTGAARSTIRSCEGRPYTPCDLIAPQLFHIAGERFFHDTMGQLLHQCRGFYLSFTPEQLDAYSHLNCGSIIDLVGPSIPGLAECHQRAFEDIESVRGIWREQQRWYESRAV